MPDPTTKRANPHREVAANLAPTRRALRIPIGRLRRRSISLLCSH